jgi:general secretion pathway protein A
MDFLNFFGLKEDPFKLTPDPAYFYPSSSHNEGLLLMDYSIEQKEGFFLLIGDPGTGKTTLLNVFLEKWKSKAEIAMILTPRLSPEEFLISIIEDLNIHLESKNKNEIIKTFRDFMIKKAAENKRVIIIVDEAQNLPDETLEELRLLSNLETDKEKLLQIILIGQPELESRLTNRLKQLNQRITTRVYLKHFSAEETMDYINCRLIKAGKKNLKIHKKAKKLIHSLSHGIPRLINMLMSRALMAAYLEEKYTILPSHIQHAVKSLSHSEIKAQRQRRLIAVSSGVMAVILLALIAYFYMQYKNIDFLNKLEESQKIGQTLSLDKSGNEQSIGYDIAEYTCEEKDLPEGTQTTARDEEHAFKFISVKIDPAEIREAPSTGSKKVGWTSKGSSFVVLREVVDSNNLRWYQILHRGKKRWISERFVKIIEFKE